MNYKYRACLSWLRKPLQHSYDSICEHSLRFHGDTFANRVSLCCCVGKYAVQYEAERALQPVFLARFNEFCQYLIAFGLICQQCTKLMD